MQIYFIIQLSLLLLLFSFVSAKVKCPDDPVGLKIFKPKPMGGPLGKAKYRHKLAQWKKSVNYDLGDIVMVYNATKEIVTYENCQITLYCVGSESVYANLCSCTDNVLDRVLVTNFDGNYVKTATSYIEDDTLFSESQFQKGDDLYTCQEGTWRCPCTYFVDCSCIGVAAFVCGILGVIFGVVGIPCSIVFAMCYSGRCHLSDSGTTVVSSLCVIFNLLLIVAAGIVTGLSYEIQMSICSPDTTAC